MGVKTPIREAIFGLRRKASEKIICRDLRVVEKIVYIFKMTYR